MNEAQADEMLALLRQLSEDNDDRLSVLEDIKHKLSSIDRKINANNDLSDVMGVLRDIESAIVSQS